MDPNDDMLTRARCVYERARIQAGLRMALLVVPLVLLSFAGCGRASTSLVVGAVLAALVGTLTWRGGAPGRAVVPGLVAGTISLAFPLGAVRLIEHLRGGAGLAIAACAIGGLVGGLVVARFAGREPEPRARFLLAGGLLAMLAGTLGCMDAGIGGLVAMILSLAAVSPLALLTPTRAS